MKRRSIGANYSMCVQPTFIVGTYNEDGSANFAPITWISVTCPGDGYLLVMSMFGEKRTKQNVMRTGQLTVNLASTGMLPLVDRLGSVSGNGGGKAALSVACAPGASVAAPALDDSPWVYECKVARTVNTGRSDTFFCEILDIQLDETVEARDTFGIDLTKLDPVIYSGQYHSVGRLLGKIGDFLPKED